MNLEKLELVNNLAFGGLIDLQSEILDHKAAISFNNTSSRLHSCVKNLYSTPDVLCKRKASETSSVHLIDQPLQEKAKELSL